jgi:hypothetical protein
MTSVHTHVYSQFIFALEINQYAAATSGAEFMRTPLVAKEVRDQMIISGVEIDICSLREDEQIAIAAADGTVAANDFVV